jgi:hypothetical protein
VRNGDQVDNFETVRQRKDGSLINVSLTISPIKGAEGKVVGAVRIASGLCLGPVDSRINAKLDLGEPRPSDALCILQ